MAFRSLARTPQAALGRIPRSHAAQRAGRLRESLHRSPLARSQDSPRFPSSHAVHQAQLMPSSAGLLAAEELGLGGLELLLGDRAGLTKVRQLLQLGW